MVEKGVKVMKNKGQALTEFILILPVFMLIVFSLVDFGTIIYKKYTLENDMDVIVDLYKQDKTVILDNYINKNKLNINYQTDSDLTTITLEKKIEFMTPGLSLVMDNPYVISIKRVIYEQ